MKSKLHTFNGVAVLVATVSIVQLASANTALWIGNSGVTTTTNWSDNANWNNIGAGGAGALQNDVKFGGAGSAGSAGTITSVVDANQHPLSMAYTNAPGQFHTTFIPAGVGLTNDNGLTVGGLTADAYTTVVNLVGDGTFVQNGTPFTVQNFGAAASTALATLDLSGLSNFVYNSSAGTINVGGTGGNRSAGALNLAGVSNNITVGTINLGTGSGANAATSNFRMGAGTNIINVGTFNIVNNKNSATSTFLNASGGLRLRGVGGTDSDRANFTIANRNQTGTGTATGTLALNGHPVDIKAATMIVGQNSAGSSVNTGAGVLSFDTGILDATTINMAVCSNPGSGAAATGTINVGSGATLIAGSGGLSLVNRTGSAATATGNLNISGGTVISSNNIIKTTGPSSTGNITMTGGSLTVAAGKTIGTPAIPIDNLNLTSATLNLAVFNNLTNIAAGALNLVDAANTVNISALPSIGAFPTQIPIITYTSFPGAGSLNLGTLPGSFFGYVSNDTVNTLWLVITNGPFIAKADLWSGGINNLWDTSTLNWTNAGVAVSYNNGDFVTFDDTAKTNNVNLTAAHLPTTLLVSNNVLNYTFSGIGSIGGTVTLLKDGTGSLTLTETGGDNFSAGIVVSNGTLILDNANSAISGGLTVYGGAIAQIGNTSSNGVLPSGSVAADGTLVFKRTNDLTVATAISGAGSLVKSASGKLTLTGINAYTGSTVVSNGTLALTGAGTISNSAQVAVTSAILDVTGASGQTILSTLNLTNASLSLAMPDVTTPVNATGLNMGGAGNTINVSSLPTIASYPVTVTLIQSASTISGFNATLGTLPPGSPSYAGSVALSGDQLAVSLTLTAGPVDVRPSMFWNGADVPNLNTNWSDGLNWLLPGAPTAADNVIFNSTATAAASALTTPGGGSSVLDPANFNNIVDANFSIASLTYTNLGGTYHNTHLNNGRTLNLTNNLTVGAVDSGATAQQEGVTISGSSATLTINNTNANLQIWVGSGSVGGSQATLDLSALDAFSATVGRLTVGASVNNAVNRPSGILYLAKTNTIIAGFQTTTMHAGTTIANAGITAADANQNAGSASTIYLGQINTIRTDTMGIGRAKATGHFRFNPIYANIAPYPTLNLQGYTSSRVSDFSIADGVGNTGTTAFSADTDLSGGIVTANIDVLNVGRSSSGGTGANTTTGTLTFDAGTITVNTATIGSQTAATKSGVGTVNVNTNSTIGDNAHLIVNGSLNLATNLAGAGAAATAGTLNINGGTVQVNNIIAGASGATSAINLTDGTLIVTNTAGTPAAPITTLNLTGGKLQLSVDSNSGVASLVATTITPSGTTTLNIGAIVNVGSSNNFPFISYTGADPFGNLSLGTYPAGYIVTLVDNIANSTVDVSIVPPAQAPQIASITIGGGNVTISGTGGVANASYTVLGSTNLTLPLASWTVQGTGSFDSSGNFSFSTTVGPGPQRFYLVRIP